MKLPQVIDAEDVRIAFHGLAYAAIAAFIIVGVAATAGLAWTVFRLAGGL